MRPMRKVRTVAMLRRKWIIFFIVIVIAALVCFCVERQDWGIVCVVKSDAKIYDSAQWGNRIVIAQLERKVREVRGQYPSHVT